VASDKGYVFTAMLRQSAFGELEDKTGRPLIVIIPEGVYRSVLILVPRIYGRTERKRGDRP